MTIHTLTKNSPTSSDIVVTEETTFQSFNLGGDFTQDLEAYIIIELKDGGDYYNTRLRISKNKPENITLGTNTYRLRLVYQGSKSVEYNISFTPV